MKDFFLLLRKVWRISIKKFTSVLKSELKKIKYILKYYILSTAALAIMSYISQIFSCCLIIFFFTLSSYFNKCANELAVIKTLTTSFV